MENSNSSKDNSLRAVPKEPPTKLVQEASLSQDSTNVSSSSSVNSDGKEEELSESDSESEEEEEEGEKTEEEKKKLKKVQSNVTSFHLKTGTKEISEGTAKRKKKNKSTKAFEEKEAKEQNTQSWIFYKEKSYLVSFLLTVSKS